MSQKKSQKSRNRANQGYKPKPFIENKNRFLVIPIIPYERPVKTEFVKGDYIVIKCRTNPANADSPTYEIPIPYFRTGTPEQYLKWLCNARKACVGQNCVSSAEKFGMFKRLLEGEAKAVFSMEEERGEITSDEHFETCVNKLTEHVFPTLAAVTQNRYMKRFMKKPPTASIREYVARVKEMNEYFPLYPRISPTKKEKKIRNHDLKDIIEFGLPGHWKRAMLHQNFNFDRNNLSKLVEFCERLNITDPHTVSTGARGRGNNNQQSNKQTTDNNNQNTSDICAIHGVGHTTEGCWTIKRERNKALKNKSSTLQPNKESVLAMVAAANKSVAEYNPKRKAQVKFDQEELNNFESLSIADDNMDQRPEDVFSESDEDL